MFSYAQSVPDTTGWVQPWLDDNGRVVEMNTALMHPDQTDLDSLFFRVEFQFPKGQAPYHSTVLGLQFEPTLGLPCYAIKAINAQYGQVWSMFLPNNQPIQSLFLRGFKTTRIVQTGQK